MSSSDVFQFYFNIEISIGIKVNDYRVLLIPLDFISLLTLIFVYISSAAFVINAYIRLKYIGYVIQLYIIRERIVQLEEATAGIAWYEELKRDFIRKVFLYFLQFSNHGNLNYVHYCAMISHFCCHYEFINLFVLWFVMIILRFYFHYYTWQLLIDILRMKYGFIFVFSLWWCLFSKKGCWKESF